MMTNEPFLDIIKETARILTQATAEGAINYKLPQATNALLTENVFKFSGFKSYQSLANANLLLLDDKGNIKPFSTFKKEVKAIDDKYNANYLNTEYNFAVSSAQAAGQWADVERDGDHYDLQYRTAADERVRESHRILDLTTLPPSDPFWSQFYPPNGWNCRCKAVKVRKGKYPTSDSEDSIQKGERATTQIAKDGANKAAMFRFNPGQTQTIFPDRHPYYKVSDKALNNVMKAVDDAAKNDYITVPTKKGKVSYNIKHGKQEMTENIAIAKQLAETFNEEINLLPIEQGKKNPDSFNVTRQITQEYKITKNTKTAIDMAIRRAKDQADHIVIEINGEMEKSVIMETLRGRVYRSENIKEVIIINKGNITKLSREEIMPTTE